MPTARRAAAVLAAAVTATFAAAQPQPPAAPTPTFSPYLNLLNRFNSPAVNYYGLVRPQQQFAQQLAQMSQQQRQLATGLNRLNDEVEGEYGVYGQSVFGVNRRLRATGFIPTFNNTGHYFSSNPVRGGGGGGIRAGGGGGPTGGIVSGRLPATGGRIAGTGGAAGGAGAGVGGVRR